MTPLSQLNLLFEFRFVLSTVTCIYVWLYSVVSYNLSAQMEGHKSSNQVSSMHFVNFLTLSRDEDKPSKAREHISIMWSTSRLSTWDSNKIFVLDRKGGVGLDIQRTDRIWINRMDWKSYSLPPSFFIRFVE